MRSYSPAVMPKLTVFLSVVLLIIAQALAYKCAGDEFPLDILPKGEKYVEYGHSLTLNCTLNTSHPEADGYTSADLSFFRTNGTKRIKIDSKIFNETIIVAVLEDLPPMEYYIYCALNENGGEDKEKSCPTYVAVGSIPEIVTNFTCVSYNWEELVCRWYPSKKNVIKTEYTLTYNVSKGRRKNVTNQYSSGRGDPPPGFEFLCPKNETVKNMCRLTPGTSPHFRRAHEYHDFRLTGRNPLGYSTNTVNFNIYAHIIPNKPENITIVSQTVGSAFINWTVPSPMNSFRKGLRSKIQYRSEWDPPNEWKEIRVNGSSKEQANSSTDKRANFYVYNLTGLEFAHTRYDVRIYLQSGAAVEDSYWSEPGVQSFITPSTIPGKAPDTALGSFHMTSMGNDSNVIIYWRSIPDSMKNGEDFSYNVTCIANNGKSCGPPLEKTLSYAKYAVSSNYDYRFTIYSVNKVGRSVNSSQVYVPKWGTVPLPESFTYTHRLNGVDELSWLPVRLENLSNYTIFWCKEELPCNGTIDWVDIDKNVTVTKVPERLTKQLNKFAIAANLKDGSSSGMVWFSCLVLHGETDKIVKEIIVRNVSTREADIVWRIECTGSSSFRGYYLYYCPVLSAQSNECQDASGEQAIFVDGFDKKDVMLKKLKPYTTYRVQISIVSYNGTQEKIGPRSKSARFTTMEDVVSASKSTALLVWIACICIFIVILAVLFYIVKRGWLHCRKMKDVEVKLPPGLQSQDTQDLPMDWPPIPNDAMKGFVGPGLAPDEPLLMGNKSEEHNTSFNIANGKNGGDSSGCSVGRESMSSSAASDNHASSDSGAEADECMNGSFGGWDSVQRQPNNTLGDGAKTRGHIRKGLATDDPMETYGVDDWNQGEPPAPVYTRVGFTDGPNAEKSLPGKGYVTISSMPPLSPPQKAINECNYNSLPLDNYPLLYEEESGGSDSGAKGPPTLQSNPSPSYVTLAYLQERGVDESANRGAVPNVSRSVLKESDKCQDDKRELPAESPHSTPSTSEADKNLNFSKRCAPMPPYVSMVENPGTASSEDGEEDEEEEEEEDDKELGAIAEVEEKDEEEAEAEAEARTEENRRLSPDLGASGIKTVSEINSKIGKDGERYSNYIPHRVFGQESVHTQ